MLSRNVTALVLMMLGISAFGFAQDQPQRASTNEVRREPAQKRDENFWWKHRKEQNSRPADDPEDPKNAMGLPLLKNIAQDQKSILTSPRHFRLSDADWLVPLGGLAAAMFATDSDVSRHLSISPNRMDDSRSFSNFGAASLVGLGGAFYLWGRVRHNEHMRETGLLSGEAALDSYLDTEAIKHLAGRERPYTDNARGLFEKGGTSFPSAHAAAAWSVAGVIAHEYPGPLTKLFAYGLASAIGVSRVTAKEHFPSDVLVGSALGWLIAQQVYRTHHNPQLWGGAWRPPSRDSDDDRSRNPENMGSPDVPIDSWVYPAFDRLAAWGYINTQFLGLRPWTRLECARLTREAADHLNESDSDAPAPRQVLASLEGEFSDDLDLLDGGRNRSLHVESLYSRFTDIAGKPLEDGYHFGQTSINDYGRPYAEGFNNITGFSGWGASGHFVAYLRGEYQYAPSIPAPALPVQQLIANLDGNPLQPPAPTPAISRFDLLEGYVGMNFANWQISFGKQSLWWGPGAGGPMLFSNNAEPINMLKISRVSPVKLPGILGWLGPVRSEFFVGQVDGHRFIYSTTSGFAPITASGLPSPQPFIHGEKFSFKPTPNLEFSVSRTAIFAGSGVPFTARPFLRSMFGLGNGQPGCISLSPVCSRLDPGDRRSAVDLAYHVPKLRKWLTFYADGFTDDQFSPIGYADRSAWTGGIYIPQLPKLHKMDFRYEGVYTDLPIGGSVSHGFFYSNDRYKSGYTNDGNLIGSWIGREGQGDQAWTSYWLSPRSKIQLGYRHQKISQQFVPLGGTLNDVDLRADLWAGRDVSVSGTVQYEKWYIKALAPVPQTNVTTALQVTFWPEHWKWR